MNGLFLASAAAIALVGAAAIGATVPGEAGDQMGAGMRFGGSHMGMRGGHRAMMGMMIARYDANNDGSITRAEIDAGLAKDFKAADTDKNGKVSGAELKAFMEARHAEMMAKMGRPADGADGKDGPPDMHREMMDPVKRLDWNLDGSLSFEEMAAPVRLLAMRLDKDGNGTITATDLMGRGPGMGGH